MQRLAIGGLSLDDCFLHTSGELSWVFGGFGWFWGGGFQMNFQDGTGNTMIETFLFGTPRFVVEFWGAPFFFFKKP